MGDRCNECHLKNINERQALQVIIYESTPFPDGICYILSEYAEALIFECNNFGKCENLIFINNILDMENGNDFYHYFVSDAEIIQKRKEHLSEVNGRYFRIFCNECMDGQVEKEYYYGNDIYYEYNPILSQCHHDSCNNRDLGMLSLTLERIVFLSLGKKRSVCLNRSDDIIAINGQCDICLATKRSREWCNECKQCKYCEKNVCIECDQKRLHQKDKWQRCKEPELQTIKVICNYYQDGWNSDDYSDFYDSWCPSPSPSQVHHQKN